MLVLRLKAAKSFLETKIRITRCEEQISSGIGEDPDKPKIFIKKNVRNNSYQRCIRYWRRSGL